MTGSAAGTLSVQTGEMATAGSWGATTIPKNTNGGYAVIGISVRGGGAAAQPRFYASIVG